MLLSALYSMLWFTATRAHLREEVDLKELWFMPELEPSYAENGKEKLKAKFFLSSSRC